MAGGVRPGIDWNSQGETGGTAMDVEQQGRRQPLASGRNDRLDSERWSPRARRLIEETHALCNSWLEAPLRNCLNDAEQRLYTLAERSHSHLDQQLHIGVRQQLQLHRAQLEQSFFTAVRRRFGGLGAAVEDVANAQQHPLALLDQTEHEQAAALEKAGARSEARHGPLLFELGYRFAVLVSQPPLEGNALPLGPQALARAFLEASHTLDMPVRHRLLMLESFDNLVIRQLATLYETVNQHLSCDGILPQLRAFRVARSGNDRNRSAPASAVPRAPERAAAPDNTETTAQRSEPIAVLETLRNLLAQQRAGHGVGPVGDRPATAEELQLALGALQQHLTDVTQQTTRELRSAQRLREELLMQLNAGKSAEAQRTQLSSEQGDTVELFAMLVEQVAQQLQQGGNAHTLLSDLQLPLLRVAVSDRDFFDQHEHPARRLLGTVAEAANDWLDGGEGDPDRSLAAKLSQLVERARREPPSAGLYTSLLADIEHHLAMLRRKAQVAERRQVEAMQGRERLEQARRQAAKLIADRFETSPPRGLLRTLLERAWSDVLALTLLRNGEDSEVFTTRLRITDQLLGRMPVDDREQLLFDVETGLQQIGMHVDEASQVAQRLLGTPEPASLDENTPTTTGLAMKLKQHQRLGEHQGAEPAATPATPVLAAHHLTPQEQRIHDHLRKLPFGSWFEFIDPANGRITPRKLAWFSPISGNSLFVTRRGLRSEEISLEQLAREIACGRVREAPPSRDSLLDRAMHALAGSLRQPSATRPEGDRP